MKIKRLYAENVFKFDKIDINFEQDTFLILANTDGDFSKSNGVGKSAVMELVIFALFGKTIRGLNDISKYHTGKFKVELEFDNNKIIRTDKRVKFQTGDADPHMGRKTEMQKYINNRLKLDYDMLAYTYIFDSDNTFFNLDDSSKKNILMKLISIDFIDDLYEKVKDKLSDMNKNRLDKMIEIYVEELKDIDKVKIKEEKTRRELLNIQAEEDGIRKYLEFKKQVDKDAPRYKEMIDENKSRRRKLKVIKQELAEHNMDEEIEELQKELGTLKDKRSQAGVKEDNACEKLNSFVDTPKCPTCDSDLSEEYRGKFKMKYESERQKAEKEYLKYEVLVKKLEEEIKVKKKSKIDYDNKKVDFEAGKKKYYDVKAQIKDLRDEIRKFVRDYKEYRKYKDSKVSLQDIRTKQIEFADVQAQYKMLLDKQAKLEEYKKTNNKLKKNIEDFEVIKKVFGKDGLKQFAVAKIVDFLQGEINDMLIKIFDDMTIKIDTDFNVDKRNTMKIRVVRKGQESELKEFSKGERRVFEIVFQIAMYKLFSKFSQTDISIMFFDEIFDPIDGHNSGIITDILSLLDTEDKTIFVISHDDEMKRYFKNHLIVSSDGENSWIGEKK